ncbi:CBS domain-containing protein/sporulation protein YlmC with PRC-barrel domain [Variovorax sp. GrIS 2.14]|uniref:magnesium transporter MgtE N-terminal domain-containing protein n=1 Tax=Variovorax sp. GrIS 2.14 TaxID=3071709 RepID=UPI0038F7D76E
MTTSPAASTSTTGVSLSSLLKRSVVDADHNPLGRVEDAITRLRDDEYPLLTGLVIAQGGTRVFVPANDILSIDPDRVLLRAVRLVAGPFERRDGEVLLKQDVLGHRLLDVGRSVLVRAYDIRLVFTKEGWAAIGLDVHKHRWFQFGAHEHHPARDWHAFLLLVGSPSALRSRFAASKFRRLKPAQLADIIEGASPQEQNLLLAQVHADPELEADVFEELDEDRQTLLFRSRSDAEVADVLSRMRADDAADAIMDLPQMRRQKVLDLLPSVQNTKVMALLGYNAATAGGLMGTDYLALSEDLSVADALAKLREATTQQPEALTTIHSLRKDGTLAGTLTLVRALQIDPGTLLSDAADTDTVVASPDDDIVAVTTRMADFNLLTLPVLDPEGRVLGVVTVDDALEAAIPRDWYRRASGGPTATRRSKGALKRDKGSESRWRTLTG